MFNSLGYKYLLTQRKEGTMPLLEKTEIEKFADLVVGGNEKARKADKLFKKGVILVMSDNDPLRIALIQWVILNAVREAIKEAEGA